MSHTVRTSLLLIALALVPLLGGCSHDAGPIHAGQAAPALAVTSLTGATHVVQPAPGHALWLTFWATWCHSCKTEWPALNQAQRDLAAQGVTLVAIDVNEPQGDVQLFLRQHATSLDVEMDPQGKAAARFGVYGFPTHVLIDGRGTVRSIIEGPLDETRVRAILGLTGDASPTARLSCPTCRRDCPVSTQTA